MERYIGKLNRSYLTGEKRWFSIGEVKMKPVASAMLLTALAVAGCSTAPWSRRQSTTTNVFEAGARYTSIAAAGAAGYYGGKGLGLDDGGAAAAGVGAGALMYAFNKFGDKGKQQAYDAGIADGSSAARAEILRNNWTREAIYGIKPEGSTPKLPKTRRVYVPTRNVNGVTMQGGYQEVQYYP